MTMQHTFVFVDLAGYTALTEAHGDDTGADLVQRFVSIAEDALDSDGRLVGVNGDAVFIVAPEPAAGLRIVTRMFQRTAGEADFPALRAGLHHGDAAARGEQYYGSAVNLAARVAAHATSGQALGTAGVAAVAQSLGRQVRSVGSVSLKNVRDPVELFWLAMSDDVSQPIDPTCRMRVVSRRAAAHLRLGNAEYWFCSRECLHAFVTRAHSSDSS